MYFKNIVFYGFDVAAVSLLKLKIIQCFQILDFLDTPSSLRMKEASNQMSFGCLVDYTKLIRVV